MQETDIILEEVEKAQFEKSEKVPARDNKMYYHNVETILEEDVEKVSQLIEEKYKGNKLYYHNILKIWMQIWIITRFFKPQWNGRP